MVKFRNILVFDEEHNVIGQTRDGRVLFRFNKHDGTFAVFRSHRMADDEKEFCLIMYGKLASKNDSEFDAIKAALDYNSKQDVYCT